MTLFAKLQPLKYFHFVSFFKVEYKKCSPLAGLVQNVTAVFSRLVCSEHSREIFSVFVDLCHWSALLLARLQVLEDIESTAPALPFAPAVFIFGLQCQRVIERKFSFLLLGHFFTYSYKSAGDGGKTFYQIY